MASPDGSPSAPSQAATTIIVISHTGLIYWWPVWLVGFILYAFTLFGGDRLAVVPSGTKARSLSPQSLELTWSGEATDSLKEALQSSPDHEAFPIHLTSNRHLGLLFGAVLLLVIFGTNVLLRGMWSLLAILLLLLFGAIFVWLRLWGPIIHTLGSLDIYLTGPGYLFISTVLFLFWVITVFIFDPRRYMIFTPGQVIFHREVGDQRQVFDTTQIKVEKRRSDLLRHYILGFDAGDLLITLATGAGQQQFELPNVLFADSKIRLISEVMKIRPVLSE